MKVHELPHITKITHSIEPLWASDTGRVSNSGKYSGTFIGYFNKLIINVGTTNQTQLTQIRNAIELPILNITYKDTRTGQEKTEQFYGTAIQTESLNYKKGIYAPFSFSLTAIAKRSDM